MLSYLNPKVVIRKKNFTYYDLYDKADSQIRVTLRLWEANDKLYNYL